MANPWFRLYSEFATDPKVQMLSEVNQRRYVMALCLRCSNENEKLHDDAIAFQLRISNEDWAKTKTTLVGVNLIDDLNAPTGWNKRQYVSDSSTERVAKYRMKQKQQRNVSVTSPDTDTDTDTDTDADADADADIKISKRVTKKTATSTEKKTVPYKKIIELYHECLPGLPAVAKLTAKRKSQVRQRFYEDMSSLDYWKNFFSYVNESDFLMGRTQPTGERTIFRADFEWLTNTGNFTKISEGKYHVRKT